MKLIPVGTNKNDLFMTPEPLAKAIISHYHPKGKLLEPCKGTGNFLKYMPKADWCEITEGRDFLKYTKKVDWIITNPPFSKFRSFLNKSMEISKNIVFLTTINHFWLKARIRDINRNSFAFKEILMVDTPKTFPASGFQIGIVYLKKGWKGKCRIKNFKWNHKV